MWTLGFSLTLGSRGRHHSKFLKAGRTSPLSHGETPNTVTFLPGPPHTWGGGGGGLLVGQLLKHYWGTSGTRSVLSPLGLLMPRTDDGADPISPFFQARWPFVDFETESQGKHLSSSNSSKQ